MAEWDPRVSDCEITSLLWPVATNSTPTPMPRPPPPHGTPRHGKTVPPSALVLRVGACVGACVLAKVGKASSRAEAEQRQTRAQYLPVSLRLRLRPAALLHCTRPQATRCSSAAPAPECQVALASQSDGHSQPEARAKRNHVISHSFPRAQLAARHAKAGAGTHVPSRGAEKVKSRVSQPGPG